MDLTGIIAEYNPFHNGHKFQLEQTRRFSSHVVCVMSGSFVQRGDMAITDKWIRAAHAVENGADLVIQLPACYSVAGAETFARAGVQILARLGATRLCFGSESGELSPLLQAADDVRAAQASDLMTAGLSAGESYPTALSNAIATEESRAILRSPNNLLGIEYINTIRRLNLAIEPVTIKREQVDHDSTCAGISIASASLIRERLYNGSDAAPYLPYKPETGALADRTILEYMLIYRLKTMQTASFLMLPDVSEGLHNRLYRAAQAATSYQGFLEAAKTKRYTLARLRRIAIAALLGITPTMQLAPPQYIQVLAANCRGFEVLAQARQGDIPIATKFADLRTCQDDTSLAADILATDLFSLCCGQGSGRDYTTSPRVIQH